MNRKGYDFVSDMSEAFWKEIKGGGDEIYSVVNL